MPRLREKRKFPTGHLEGCISLLGDQYHFISLGLGLVVKFKNLNAMLWEIIVISFWRGFVLLLLSHWKELYLTLSLLFFPKRNKKENISFQFGFYFSSVNFILRKMLQFKVQFTKTVAIEKIKWRQYNYLFFFFLPFQLTKFENDGFFFN